MTLKEKSSCSFLENQRGLAPFEKQKTKKMEMKKMKVSKTVFESILKKARKRFPSEKGVAAFSDFAKKGFATFESENCAIKINDYGYAIAYEPGSLFKVFSF